MIYIMNNRKQKYIIIGALCLVVTLLSIGYAVLSATLRINGTAKVSGEKWSVEFVEKQARTIPKGKAACDIGTIANTSVTNLLAKVKVPGDSCTFTIPVENTGTLDASLVDVTNKALSLSYDGNQEDIDIISSYITYDVRYGNTQVNNETNFDSIDILEPGERETITLKVEFKEEATQIPNAVVTVTGLDRTFNFENKVGSSTTSPTPNTTPVFNDTSGANQPVLSDNMIPVVYDETRKEWVKQNLDKSYDYSQQVWANAVTVVEDGTQTRSYYKKAKAGTVISMEDINTMWVWIPRYSYTIKSEDGENYYGKASSDNQSPTQELPGEIDVKFIPISENDSDGSAQYTEEEPTGWFTPPGFKFGDKDLSGVWVGKFETGSIDGTDHGDVETDNLVAIKPNITSWRNIRVSTLELVSMGLTKTGNVYGFDNTYDSHAIKNTEWALMVYLTQSKYGKYGNALYTGSSKEVYINNYNKYVTGCSGGAGAADISSECSYHYDNLTTKGQGTGYAGAGASTTGNVYGIYDTNGGAWEYVMGSYSAGGQKYSGTAVSNNSGYVGKINSGTADFSENAREWQADKYYDFYTSGDTLTACNGNPCKGHALNEFSQWYNDGMFFILSSYPWLYRGHDYGYNATSGIFGFSRSGGHAYGGARGNDSFRIVLTPNN